MGDKKKALSGKKTFWKDLGAALPLMICVSFLVGLYTPLELYFTNQLEFWFDFYTLIPVLLCLFGLVVAVNLVVLVICRLINRKLFYAVSILEAVGFICTYIQGNFLVSNLPALDGRTVDWSVYTTDNLITLAMWVVLIAVAIVAICKIGWKKAAKYSRYAVMAISLMLVITLGTLCLTTGGTQKKVQASVTYKDILTMSEDKNFVIFLLDALDSTDFQRYLEADQELQETLSDFTVYPNMLGAYPYTNRSIPFIFSGIWFENSVPYQDWAKEAYENGALFRDVQEHGYSMGLYETLVINSDKCVSKYENIVNGSKTSQLWKFMKLECKLSLFKLAPYILKEAVFFQTTVFRDLIDAGENESAFTANNRVFYDMLLNQGIVARKQPTFKFIHLEGAHVPHQYDVNLNVVKNANYTTSVEACGTLIKAYLSELKKAGVYDNSCIVIMADHGYTTEYKQTPAFMAKGFEEKKDLVTFSMAPVSYADLQEGFCNLMEGSSGSDMFGIAENEQRERRFLFNWNMLGDLIDEYIQVGNAWDSATMIPTGRQFNKDGAKSFRTFDGDIESIECTNVEPKVYIDYKSINESGLIFNGWAITDAGETGKLLIRHNGVVYEPNILFRSDLENSVAGRGNAGFQMVILNYKASKDYFVDFYIIGEDGKISAPKRINLDPDVIEFGAVFNAAGKEYTGDFSRVTQSNDVPDIYVDSCSKREDGFYLYGWAINPKGADTRIVLIECNGVMYQTSRFFRDDLENWVAGRGNAGFTITIPASAGDELKIYVVDADWNMTAAGTFTVTE